MNGARYYAYRVEGPWNPAEGHRFDPNKVLLDPYAKGLVFPDQFERAEACGDRNSAGHAPLAALKLDRTEFDWSGDRQVHHGPDLIIYEVHVRGFTKHPSSGVADSSRGTYRGVIDKIPYLQQLGITAVELMPIFQYDPGEGNYWGYMPLNYFSAHHAYAMESDAHEQQNEFREMVKALHAASIELILDVVYNHTSEGDERGPTYCYRGIDNASYYLLGQDRRTYRNDAGTGNVLNTATRRSGRWFSIAFATGLSRCVSTDSDSTWRRSLRGILMGL